MPGPGCPAARDARARPAGLSHRDWPSPSLGGHGYDCTGALETDDDVEAELPCGRRGINMLVRECVGDTVWRSSSCQPEAPVERSLEICVWPSGPGLRRRRTVACPSHLYCNLARDTRGGLALAAAPSAGLTVTTGKQLGNLIIGLDQH
eukprot:765524-Hanusia_phi.AAC.2